MIKEKDTKKKFLYPVNQKLFSDILEYVVKNTEGVDKNIMTMFLDIISDNIKSLSDKPHTPSIFAYNKVIDDVNDTEALEINILHNGKVLNFVLNKKGFYEVFKFKAVDVYHVEEQYIKSVEKFKLSLYYTGKGTYYMYFDNNKDMVKFSNYILDY